MKQFIYLLLFVSWSTQLLHGQNSYKHRIPDTVIAAFDAKYPDTYVYDWKWKKKKQYFSAEFMMLGDKHKARFTPDGKWIFTKIKIKRKNLPDSIYRAIQNSSYSSWRIDDVEVHCAPDKEVIYKVELEQGKREVHLYYLADGSLYVEDGK